MNTPRSIADTAQSEHISRGALDAREDGGIDSENTIEMGGQLIERMGNDLAKAASGHLLDVDMDSARLRLRDVQTALVSQGYTMDDGGDDVEHIEQGDSRALSETIRLFQDENDLEVNGRIDRDTYESIMRNFDQALGVMDHGAPEDDFHFLHTSEPLGNGDGLTEPSEDAPGLDADDPGLLNLEQELDAGIAPQELEDL